MKRLVNVLGVLTGLALVALAYEWRGAGLTAAMARGGRGRTPDADQMINSHARVLIEEGGQTFRFDTFGDEAFWGDTLKIHRAIAGAASVVSARECHRQRRSPSASRWTRTRSPSR